MHNPRDPPRLLSPKVIQPISQNALVLPLIISLSLHLNRITNPQRNKQKDEILQDNFVDFGKEQKDQQTNFVDSVEDGCVKGEFYH